MSALPSETFERFCPYHDRHGFDRDALFNARENCQAFIGDRSRDGWRVVPVTVQITATGTGLSRATLADARTGM